MTNKDNIERLRLTFAGGVQRLARMVELKAPDNVLANEIALLFRKAAAAFGQDLANAMNNIVFKPLRCYCGICYECDNDIDCPKEDHCVACQLDQEIKYGEYGEDT